MDHVYSTTTKHEKGKHLSYDERVLIQIRLKDGWSANKIAKEIGCAPNTVRNEIRRGTVSLYSTLVALTLLIAESKPQEKEIMINIVMNFLTW